MTSVSETIKEKISKAMIEKWQDPTFSEKTKAALEKSLDERMKKRLLKLAGKG